METQMLIDSYHIHITITVFYVENITLWDTMVTEIHIFTGCIKQVRTDT